MAISGTSKRDILRGGPLPDRIEGLDGDDDLFGLGGEDTLVGSDGNDFLKGGEQADRLFGGADNDVLVSGERDPVVGQPLTNGSGGGLFFGRDLLSGGSGDDRLIVTLDCEDVEIDGGSGIDTLQIGFDEVAVKAFLDAFPSAFQTDPSLFEATVDLPAGTGRYRFNGSLIDLELIIGEVENVDGSAFSETIVGDNSPNLIRSKGGNDTILGGFGADTIDGGLGRDRANYEDLFSGATIDLTLTIQSGSAGAGGDRLISIEDIGGTRNADLLRGDSNANGLFGNGGDDVLEGRGGADTLSGGSGRDTASYASSRARVIVQLADAGLGIAGVAAEGDAAGDTLSSIENLLGSEFGDNLTGNSGPNVLSGGNGNDALLGLGGDDTIEGGNGNDLIDGGQGVDTATFAGAAQGVQVTLRDGGLDGSARQSFLFTDTLRGIENVVGSAFDDAIFGNAASNLLEGGGGADYFGTNAGADTFDGGEGLDTLDMSAEAGAVRLDLAVGSDGRLTYAARPGETDIVRGLERFVGTPFGDVLIGSQAFIAGLIVNETLLGGGGDDTFVIDQPGTIVQESANRGFDRVQIGGFSQLGAYGLPAGQSIERIETENPTSTRRLDLTGNELDQTIVGNAGPNMLSGAGGRDVLDGGGGDDTLAGGEGDDFLNGGLPVVGAPPELDLADYSTSTVGVTVNIGVTTPQNTGQGLDTLFSIEGVVGSAFDDSLFAFGRAGLFRGGLGSDTVTFEGVTSAIGFTVTLGQTGTQNLAVGFSDTLESIENVTGTVFGGDILSGEFGDNRLNGLGGNDRLAGLGGNDTLFGGTGDDTFDFIGQNLGSDFFFDESGADLVRFSFRDLLGVSQDGSDLIATLTTGSFRVFGHFAGAPIEQALNVDTGALVTLAVGLTGGDAAGIIAGTAKGDTLDGRGGDDLLYGNGGKDLLLGGLGNDLLDGGEGKDTLDGGPGNDTLVGGEGADRFVVRAGSGHDVIEDFGLGHDKIDLSALRTSFRALDTNRDGELGFGEGDGRTLAVIQGGDTLLLHAGGSVLVRDAARLGVDDFVF